MSAKHPAPAPSANSTAPRAWLAGPRLLLGLLMGLLMGLLSAPVARAATIDVVKLEAQRSPEGVLLDLETRFDLTASVLDALQKGVTLHFVAQAQLMRPRWYWFDKPLAQTTRTWRLSYQPLTFQYRVSLGGLSQSFGSLREALGLIQRNNQWRIADPLAADDDGRYYVELSFKLDTAQLPRPLLIGIGSQPEWALSLERVLPLGLATH